MALIKIDLIRRAGFFKEPKKILDRKIKYFMDIHQGPSTFHPHVRSNPRYIRIEFHSEMASKHQYARKIALTTKDGSKYMKIFYCIALHNNKDYDTHESTFGFNEGVKVTL